MIKTASLPMPSPRTVRSPTDDERAELRRMKQQEVGRVAMRAHMVLLSARGYSAYEIADLHDMTDPAVYKWIERFDTEGPAGLYDRDREGRPPKIDDEAEALIEKLLQTNPTEVGENATRWTAPRIQKHLKERLDIDVHEETVREALKRLEYSWTRPRRQLPKPETYSKQRARVLQCIAEAGAETTVLFEDETEIKRFAPLRRMWQKVGEQRAVTVPDANADVAIYGALNPETGQVITRACEKGRSDYTIQFLKDIAARTTGKVLLVWDRATWHTSTKVEAFLAQIERIETLLLPPRSPEMNPVEDVWREMKAQVTACITQSLGTLVARCRQYVQRLSPTDALRTAGLS
jgi:transposase